MHEIIRDITACIVVAWLLGIAAQFARQPVFLAYLIAGFVLGPFGGRFVTSRESIGTIAELGLIFLLFMIGLEIDLKKIVQAGRTILVTAAAQILGGVLLGVLFFRLIGMPMAGQRWDALYFAVAAALSSTVIIVKILYEKRELDTFPGRITLGVLVLQDIFVILFMAVQPSLDDLAPGVALLSAARVAGLIAAAFLIGRYLLPYLFHHIARLPELVVVGALAWCFFLGEVAVRLDLSREMGALVAGVTLSTFPYAPDVTAKVTGLRDFFITLFFVALGMTIPTPTPNVIGLAAILAGFTVLSRLVTTFLPLYAMRSGLRASLLPAINLCQLSEFALVVVQLGVSSGQVSAESAGATSLAFAVLAVLSTGTILHSDGITRALIPMMKRLGMRDLEGEDGSAGRPEAAGHGGRIMLLGFHRAASSLFAELERLRPDLLAHVCVVDFNPLVYEGLTSRGHKAMYGDISHRHSLEHAGVAHAEIVITSVPDSLLKATSNAKIVRDVRRLNPSAKIIAVAESMSDVSQIYAAGADYVVIEPLAVADGLWDAIRASEAGLVSDLRKGLDARLKEHRRELLS